MNKFSLIYWANKVSLKKSAGQLERLSSLLAKSTIDLNPHQIHATVFALNSPLSRGAILADEVGLGKTIEAGIIVKEFESFTETGKLIMDKNNKNPKIIRWTDGKEAIMVRGDKTIGGLTREKPLSRWSVEYWRPHYEKLTYRNPSLTT